MDNRRDAVAPTVERILMAVEPVHLDADQRSNLGIALAEALSNAAVHGHGHRSDAPAVRVVATVHPGREATVEVIDAGGGFDHASVSDPTDPERILLPGGRGVFLMRRLVDEVEYNRKGNRVKLVVRRRQA